MAGGIDEPYFVYGPSNILAILKIFTRDCIRYNLTYLDSNETTKTGK